MRGRFWKLLGLMVILVLAGEWAIAGSAPASVGPSKVVEDLLGTVKKIKKAENDTALTPAEQRQNSELSKEVHKSLDIEGISAYALHDHWNKRSPQEKRAFVETFTTLLEKVAYTNTGKFLKDLDPNIKKEKILGKKAMVYTSVIHEKEGRIDIDFKLRQASTSWVVDDVILDGVSLVRNLRTQCLKIVRDDSFQELLRRMREKIEKTEVDEDIDEITGRY